MNLTPDEQAAADAGYTMPQGLDRLTDGDDAIRDNAALTHQRRFDRGYLTDANLGLTPGAYSINAASANNPFAYNATLITEAVGSQRIQVAKKWGNDYTVSMRWGTTSGTWGEWRRIDAAASLPTLAAELDDYNSLTEPSIQTVHANLNAMHPPGPGTWTVLTSPTTAAGHVHQIAFGQRGEILTRFNGGTSQDVWSDWFPTIDMNAIADHVRQIAPLPPRSGMRTVPLSLTLGSGGMDAPTAGTVRLPMQWAAPITRWRIRMRNINPRTGIDRGDVDLTGIWVGPAGTAGAFATTPEQVTGPTTVPSGTGWASRWQTTPLGDGGELLLSYGYTAASAPWLNVGGCWRGTDSALGAQQSAAGLSPAPTAPLHVWIEAETYAHTPVAAVAGDSLACGVGATVPVFDSAISAWCRAHNALPVHYAASGDGMIETRDPSHYKWSQFDGTDAPDSVLWVMGSNDVFNPAVDLPEMKARAAAYSARLAALTPAIYAGTITPRTGDTSTQEQVRREYNAWLRTQPHGIRDVFEFAEAVSPDDESLTPEFDADGTHLTTAGYSALADAITRPITAPPVLYAHPTTGEETAP